MTFLNEIKNILALILVGIAILWNAFRAGKNSVKNKENEEAANAIRNLNKTKKDVSHLSDSELDSELQKWRRIEDK